MGTTELTVAGRVVPVAIAGLVAVASALLMVTRRDVVRGALWLVVTLIAIAVLYVTLGAEFLAMVQVIVYAGAIMVLFLFVIVLLAAGREPLSLRNTGIEGIAAVTVALGMLVLIMFATVAGGELGRGPAPTAGGQVAGALAPQSAYSTPLGVGQALFSPRNVFTVELISVLLVAAMAGVIVLAKGLRRDAAISPGSEGTHADAG
jgi:NADH-quinone oxidoreductase subunit J